MIKFKNMILLLSAVLLLGLPLDSRAAVTAVDTRVFDQADLLTSSEEEELDATAKEYSEQWDMDFAVVTTADADGKSSEAYADDFYDARFNTSEDGGGILFLIDMDNRQIYVSTSGMAIRYLTDGRIENILDEAYEKISDGDYFGTFETFFETTEYYLKKGIPSDQANYDTQTGELDRYVPPKKISVLEFLIALIVALAASIGTCAAIVGRYQLKFEDFHYNAFTDSGIALAVNDDRLSNTFVTHRRIPKSSSSGGSISSTHSSSGGHSHGGGGRGF